MLLHSICRGLLVTLHIKTRRIAPGSLVKKTGDREVQTDGRSARYRGSSGSLPGEGEDDARCDYGEA